MKKKISDKITSPTDSADHEEWKVQQDFDHMMKAEEIKSDPERLAKVHKRVGRHKKAITSIEDIKTAYNEKVADSNKFKGV